MGKHSSQWWLLVAATLIFPAGYAASQTKADASDSQNTSKHGAITLWMNWQRGDPHYGPNFVLLNAPCQNSEEGTCECTMSFKTLNSHDFADYISSFGGDKVPVVFEVSNSSDGRVAGARLEYVGTWAADRFPYNDRLLGTELTFKGGVARKRQPSAFHGASDCFPGNVGASTPSRESAQSSSENRHSEARHAPDEQSLVPKPITVPQREMLLISKVEPEYPKDALDKRIQGTVLLKAEVSEAGNITDLTVISGHPLLTPAAMKAVMQWTYKPFLQDGRAVAIETQVQVDFRLPEK